MAFESEEYHRSTTSVVEGEGECMGGNGCVGIIQFSSPNISRMLLAQLPLSHGLWLSIPSVNDSSVVMFWTVVII